MRVLRALPLKQKVTLLVTGITGVCLLAAAAGLFGFQWFQFRNQYERDLMALAELVANQVQAPLAFRDADTAGEILLALRSKPHVRCARVRLADGEVFAEFGEPRALVGMERLSAGPGLVHHQGEILLARPVRLENETLGWLHIRADYRAAVQPLLHLYAGVLAVVLAGGLVLAAFLSARYQRLVSAPVLHLVDAARRIADQHDYTVRVARSHEGEIGELAEAFNQMLARIHEHETTLRQLNLAALHKEIADRKQAEATAQSERDRAQQYLDIAGVMLLALDREGCVVMLNERGCQLLGWELPAILGCNWFERCVPEEARAAAQARFQRNLTGTVPADDFYEGEVVNRAGERRSVAFHNTVVRDAAGKLVGTLSSGEDITERLRAEQALRSSRDYYLSLFETFPAMIRRSGTSGATDYFNRTWLAFTGRESEAAGAGAPADWLESLHPEDRAGWRDAFEDALEGRRPFLAEYRLRRFDGEYRWICDAGRPFEDLEGRFAGYLTVSYDITERKQAERSLQQRLALEELISQLSTRFIHVAPEVIEEALTEALSTIGHFTQADRCFLFLGGDASERRLFEWCARSAVGLAADQRLVSTFLWASQSFAQGTPVSIFSRDDLPPEASLEREVMAAEGVEAFLAVPLVHNGQLVAACGLMALGSGAAWGHETVRLLQLACEILGQTLARHRAETALRRSEERLRTLTENVPIGLYRNTSGPDGRLVMANRALARLYGYEAPDGMREMPVRALYARAEDWERCSGVLREQGRLDGVELVHRRRDGTTFWCLVTARAHTGAGGEVLWYDGTVEDVTARKQAEQARATAERQLEQVRKLESVGRLAAGIAHEINTPIQYIADNLRFLRDGFTLEARLVSELRAVGAAARAGEAVEPWITRAEAAAAAVEADYLDREIPKALAQSLEGVDRVARIIVAMREFSHPGAGTKAEADLNRAIESTVAVARNEWKHVAEMLLDLDPALPRVKCLPGEFNQVILNLVVNAAHAIAEAVPQRGRGRITISTRSDPDWVEVRVADTGTGIAPGIQDLIMEPFFTTKPVGKGTGQGLAIARSVIVDKHAGTLEFETEPGCGTTFIIRLPRRLPEAVAAVAA